MTTALRSGNHAHRWSSVSPRAWCISMRVAADGDLVGVLEGLVRPQRGRRQEAASVRVDRNIDAGVVTTDAELQLAGDTAELAGVDDQVPVVRERRTGPAGGRRSRGRRREGAAARPARRQGRTVLPPTWSAWPCVYTRWLTGSGRHPLSASTTACAGLHAGGVEADQTVAGVERDAVAEALDHRDAVGDLAELVGDPVHGLVGVPTVDDSG